MLAAALLLAGCASTPVVAPAAARTETGPVAVVPAVAADDNLNAVVWVQRSAEYAASTTSIYRAATARLEAALKSGQDALDPAERGNPAKGLPPAVIVDIDETVLDNSPYQARLVASGKEFENAGWDQWVAEQRARAVPGAVEFARAAEAKGITMFYISNRAAQQKEATLANLKAVGLPVKDDGVFLGLGMIVADCEQKGSEKGCRRKLVGHKYRVLMQVGDQLGDFIQVPVNTPEARAGLAGRHADWWGERWWMLPNPTYGGWEPALFNNDRKLPRDARRRAKRDALIK